MKDHPPHSPRRGLSIALADPSLDILTSAESSSYDRSGRSSPHIALPAPPPGTIEVVLFSTDDVLYDASIWQRQLLQLLGRMGVYTHCQAFYTVWRDSYLGRVYRGENEYDDVLRSFLVEIGLTAGRIEEVALAVHTFIRRFHETVRPFAGVPGTLRRLTAASIRLGILCNADCSSQELRRQLRRIDLADFFETIITSRDLHAALPDEQGYRTALRAMRVEPSRCIFVGCHANELTEAVRRGFWTVAFNPVERLEKVHFTADRFQQIADWIESTRTGSLVG